MFIVLPFLFSSVARCPLLSPSLSLSLSLLLMRYITTFDHGIDLVVACNFRGSRLDRTFKTCALVIVLVFLKLASSTLLFR